MSSNEHKKGNKPYGIIKNKKQTVEHVNNTEGEKDKIHLVMAEPVSFPLSESVY